MKKVAQSITNIILAKQNSMFSSTVIVALMVIVSRVFGFIRYRIFAGFFTKEELDIYFAAFRIPDLIFEILITGALTTSLIPFFIKYQHDKEAQTVQISSVINIIMVALFVLTIVLLVFMHPLMILITPGFSSEKIDQITFFSQLLLIGQLPFFVFGTFLTGISQAKKAFLIPAVAPIIYNVAIIIVTYLFSNSLYLMAPVLGVLVGAFLFFFMQVPILFLANFEYQFIIKKTRATVEFFRVSLPRILTVIVAQIDATIDLSMTSLVGPGAYTVFYLAQHLQLLPVSVLGISFGQASLPYLSEMYNENNIEKLQKTIVSSILNIFFLTIPFVGFFVVTRTPMVRFFFGGEKFDWTATVQTAITLSIFALSLPFHSIYYFLTRCFYAIFDSKTPFVISVLSIFVNGALSLYFILVLKLPVWALAISFSISMTANVILLVFLLYKKLHGLDIKFLLFETSKMVLSMAICSVLAQLLRKLLDNLILDTTRTINIFFLLCIVSGFYFVLYLFLSWVFNVHEFGMFSKILTKIKMYQKKLSEIYTNAI